MELTKIETKYLALECQDISLEVFEQWVYASNWLEDYLGEDIYTDLISLNYKTPSAQYEVSKILRGVMDRQKLEGYKMIRILNSIILQDGKEATALRKMYNLYCRGYHFLEDLGLGIGLFLEVPYQFGADHYEELNEAQKTQLLKSVYPKAKSLAEELKQWVQKGALQLDGDRRSTQNRLSYVDNRVEKDRVSRVWIPIHDQLTGEVTAKRNRLLDHNGKFKN